MGAPPPRDQGYDPPMHSEGSKYITNPTPTRNRMLTRRSARLVAVLASGDAEAAATERPGLGAKIACVFCR